MADHPERQELLTTLDAISATATSPDGAVSLSVNTDGVLTRLELADDVTGRPAAEVADLVLATYVTALRRSTDRTAALLLPAGIGGYVVDRLKWRAKFEPGARAEHRASRSEDWGEQAVRYDQAW